MDQPAFSLDPYPLLRLDNVFAPGLEHDIAVRFDLVFARQHALQHVALGDSGLERVFDLRLAAVNEQAGRFADIVNPTPPCRLVRVALRYLVEVGIGRHGHAALAGQGCAIGGAEHENALLAALPALSAAAFRVGIPAPLQVVDRFL